MMASAPTCGHQESTQLKKEKKRSILLASCSISTAEKPCCLTISSRLGTGCNVVPHKKAYELPWFTAKTYHKPF